MTSLGSGDAGATGRFRARYGPWAVVTGASEGIGKALARRLAAEGLDVVLVARRGAALEALGAELAAAHGVRARALPLDLAEPTALDALAASTADLDVGLVVAAAGFGTTGAFVDSPLADELAMVDLNCRAVAGAAHHFGARLARRGRGGLVLLSSVFAFQGVPGSANYAATKAYVQSLAEGLRAELRPAGVDVLAVAPGPVHTGFAARAGMRFGLALQPEDLVDDVLAALGRRTTVRPGWLSKLLAAALGTAPRWARTRILAGVVAGLKRA